jgi:hypothetical protein
MNNKLAFNLEIIVTSISFEKIMALPDPLVGIGRPFATVTWEYAFSGCHLVKDLFVVNILSVAPESTIILEQEPIDKAK